MDSTLRSVFVQRLLTVLHTHTHSYTPACKCTRTHTDFLSTILLSTLDTTMKPSVALSHSVPSSGQPVKTPIRL